MDVVGIFLYPFIEVVIKKLLAPELFKLARREGVHTSIQTLKKTLETIKAVLADAEDKQTSDRAVKGWLEELHRLAYDADDILDEFSTEALRRKLMAEPESGGTSQVRRPLIPTCCTGFTPRTFAFNLTIGSKIKEITLQLQDIATKRTELGLVEKVLGNRSTNVLQRPPTTCLMNEPCVYGRDNDIKQVIELLFRDAPTENKVDVIPIVGMGGIGKTTLAQLVYNDGRVNNHLNLKAWVCVSDEFDITRITKAILESFTLHPCNLGELNEVQVTLRNALAGKKFFLVLDDVWNHRYDEWNLLRSPFEAGAHGSKSL